MSLNPIAPESPLLSSREAADLLCVSTSTVKRMCDDGVLKTHRTAGGHRRIDAKTVKDLRRRTTLETESSRNMFSEFESEIVSAIQGGVFNADQRIAWLLTDSRAYTRVLCRKIQSGNASLTKLLDCEIGPILTRVGELWSRKRMAVFEEHLITNKVFDVISALKALVAELKGGSEIERPVGALSPIALGGTQAYESHGVACAMVELVFSACDWEAKNLGVLLPESDLRAAVRTFNPSMVWLSYTVLGNVERAVTENNQVYETMKDCGTKLIIGGQALTADVRSQMRFDFLATSMRELESYIQTQRS